MPGAEGRRPAGEDALNVQHTGAGSSLRSVLSYVSYSQTCGNAESESEKYVCMYVCRFLHNYIHTRIHAYMHAYIHIYIYIYIYMYIHMFAYIYVHMHKCIQRHYTHIYMYVDTLI